MEILSIFHYEFMIRAFIAGIITAVIAPMIGIFLVTRRYSYMADTLSHVSLAGVAIGYLTGTQPIIMAMVVSAAAAVSVDQIRMKRKVFGDSALILFLSGGLAVAAVLLSISRGLNVDLSSVLFGSIATVNSTDINIIAVLGVLVIATILLFYKELVSISFNEELAAAAGLRVTLINRILVVLAAVTVSLSMRIVGILLIGALMVIPVLAAMQFSRGFRTTLLIAIAISLFSVITGLFISYYLDFSSGGTIVLIAIAIFLAAALRPGRKHAGS
ncbi:MAG TPA: metal ABC transporter permease [Candidatus Peribacteraceae bacterium]|nr:metal ABC transporter permease [Candidatus Peribacteraceae bacterium]